MARHEVDAVLEALFFAPNLRMLQLVVHGFALSPEHMYVLGMLPLARLRLDSPSFQPGLAATGRSTCGHITNEGIRALTDSICRRRAADAGDSQDGLLAPQPTYLDLPIGMP